MRAPGSDEFAPDRALFGPTREQIRPTRDLNRPNRELNRPNRELNRPNREQKDPGREQKGPNREQKGPNRGGHAPNPGVSVILCSKRISIDPESAPPNKTGGEAPARHPRRQRLQAAGAALGLRLPGRRTSIASCSIVRLSSLPNICISP